MILPGVTLFPGVMLPLYIYEPKYRRMLSEALHSTRMFTMAMRQPHGKKNIPATVAGLGLIRGCVRNPDGTSHLVLEGIARVELGEVLATRPYRIQHITPLTSPKSSGKQLDALISQLRRVIRVRLKYAMPCPDIELNDKGLPMGKPRMIVKKMDAGTVKKMLKSFDSIADVSMAADMAATAFLPDPLDRQDVMETPNLQERLNLLIVLISAEILRAKEMQNELPED